MKIKYFIKLIYLSFIGTIRVVLNLLNNSYDRVKPYEKNDLLKIICNGSSLSECNINTSFQSQYMVVNFFCLSELFFMLKPQFYVIADPAFYKDDNALNALKIINTSTTWKMTIYFINCKNIDNIKKIFDNDMIDIVNLNGTALGGFKKLKYYFYKKQIAMPSVQNVLVACLMIGLHMHFKTIELYGVDHSWLRYLTVHDDNRTYMIDTHFYDEKEVREVEFVPHGYKYHEIIEMFSRMFKSYHEIADYIHMCKIPTNIINKSKGSYIDAFKKA